MHTVPNGKIYIGVTCRRPEKRWENGNGYKCNAHFFRAIKKYGWDSIKHDIVASGLTKEAAEEKEAELIAFYKSADPDVGYNMRLGGALCSFNQQSRQKMKASHIGKKLSEEQKRKISEATKGKTASYSMLGKRHSAETKEKMSKALKGRPKPYFTGKNNPRAHGVKNKDTGEVFLTMCDASKAYRCNRVGISRCCSGLQETCGGYRWESV